MGKKKGKDKTITKTIEESVPLEPDLVEKPDDNAVIDSSGVKSDLKLDEVAVDNQEIAPEDSPGRSKSVVLDDNVEDVAESTSKNDLEKGKSLSKTSAGGEKQEKTASAQELGESPSRKLSAAEEGEIKVEDVPKSQSETKKKKKAKKPKKGTKSDDQEAKPKKKKGHKKVKKPSMTTEEEGEETTDQEAEEAPPAEPKKKKAKKAKKKSVTTVTSESDATKPSKKKKPKKDKKSKKPKEEGDEGDESQTKPKKKKGGKKSSKGSKKRKKKPKLDSEGDHLPPATSSNVLVTSQTDAIGKKKKTKKGGKKYAFSDFRTETGSSSDSSSSSSDREMSRHQIDGKSAEEGVGKKKKKGKKGGKKGKGKKRGKSEGTEDDEGESPKKKKKKEKGKKKKKKKAEATDDVGAAEVEEVDDIMAEINRMKALAAAQAAGEEMVETSSVATTATKKSKKKKKKKKKGPKKKLSKKEKARLAAENAEKARIEAEQEAARKAEEERIRLEEERKAAIEKEKREIVEQQTRMEQLEAAAEYIAKVTDYNRSLEEQDRTKRDWDNYVACGRLPDPTKCDLMNTYLHLWEKEMEETTVTEASARTADVVRLLEDLEDFVDISRPEDANVVHNLKWVRGLFREHQRRSLDVATYRLLRDVEKNLNRVDIPTADFRIQDEFVTLCLWLRVRLPTPMPNPRRPPKPRIEIDFAPIKMAVQFPVSLDGDRTAFRAMYLRYDHLSDSCDTFEKPAIPAPHRIELYEFTKQEWRQKLLYKYENRVVPPPVIKEETDITDGDQLQEEVVEKELGLDDEVEIPAVPYRKLEPTASEFVIGKEDGVYTSLRASLVRTVPDDVINLRKYTIIGGVYVMDLLRQPPQPQDFVTMEMSIENQYTSYRMKSWAFLRYRLATFDNAFLPR